MKGKSLVAALLLVTSTGNVLAAPEFLSYESRNPVREGQGGERKSINGVDFWLRGDPPRRYQILGSLTDERHKTGLYGLIRMSSLESDIAKAAKAAGGDAVILAEENDQTIGIIGNSIGSANGSYRNNSFNANGFSVGTSRAMKEHNSRYWVVKYLAENPSADVNAPLTQQPQ